MMKKVLFATTALVASAGIASADVAISGFAELGFFDNDVEFQFHTDIDATFTMSGSTDNGLSFGASIDLDESDGDPSGAFGADTQGGEVVFISGGFGTVTMGDTDGGFDWAMSEAIIGGAIADDHEHGGYTGNGGFDGVGDGQVLRYDYSFGALSFAVSLEQLANGADVPVLGDLITGVGVRYNASLGGVDLGLGLGYQECDGCDIVGASVSASFDNGFQAIVNASSADVAGVDVDTIGLAVGYSVDALTVAANWGEIETTAGGVSADVSGFGLIVNYDLGGGAVAQFGYGDTDNPGAAADVSTYSLGLALSF